MFLRATRNGAPSCSAHRVGSLDSPVSFDVGRKCSFKGKLQDAIFAILIIVELLSTVASEDPAQPLLLLGSVLFYCCHPVAIVSLPSYPNAISYITCKPSLKKMIVRAKREWPNPS